MRKASAPPSRKRHSILAAVAALTFLGAACDDRPTGLAPDLDPVLSSSGQPTEVVVLLDRAFAPGQGDANRAAAESVAAGFGIAPRHTYGTAIFGFAGTVTPGTLHALQRDPRVLSVEPVETWHLDLEPGAILAADGGQVMPTGISRTEVDRNPHVTTSGGGVVVDVDIAIMDTGIDAAHPDLNVAGGRSFVQGSPHKWEDFHGHGTHVAGTVAARDNGLGVVGVAPGARVWGLRICQENGSCPGDAIIAAIDWVAQQKASGAVDFAAANFSITSADSPNDCDAPANAIHQAICGLVDRGVLFVMSAGNYNREKVPYPAGFSVSAVADFDGMAGGVAAHTCRSDRDDALALFSNYGDAVNIAAPGVCILSTLPGNRTGFMSGTSMAAPHVTGAVALYLHANQLAPASDRAGAEAIRAAIVDAAHPQESECGYVDSRAGGPLLFANAEAFGGDGTCGVAEGEPPPPLPTMPADLAARPLSSSAIELTWTDPTNVAASIEIERWFAAIGEWIYIATVEPGVGSYTDTGLTANHTYYYRVRAVAEGGASLWTPWVRVVTPSDDPLTVAITSMSCSNQERNLCTFYATANGVFESVAWSATPYAERLGECPPFSGPPESGCHFRFPEPGTYEVTVQVTGYDGQQAEGSRAVSCRAQGNGIRCQ
jgi:subtilisin